MKGHITKEQLSDSLKNELSEFSSQLEHNANRLDKVYIRDFRTKSLNDDEIIFNGIEYAKSLNRSCEVVFENREYYITDTVRFGGNNITYNLNGATIISPDGTNTITGGVGIIEDFNNTLIGGTFKTRYGVGTTGSSGRDNCLSISGEGHLISNVTCDMRLGGWRGFDFQSSVNKKTIKNITLTNCVAIGGENGLDFLPHSDAQWLENITINNMTLIENNEGIRASTGTNDFNIVGLNLNGITIISPKRVGIVLKRIKDSIFSNIIIKDCYFHGMDLQQISNTQFNNISIEKNKNIIPSDLNGIESNPTAIRIYETGKETGFVKFNNISIKGELFSYGAISGRKDCIYTNILFEDVSLCIANSDKKCVYDNIFYSNSEKFCNSYYDNEYWSNIFEVNNDLIKVIKNKFDLPLNDMINLKTLNGYNFGVCNKDGNKFNVKVSVDATSKPSDDVMIIHQNKNVDFFSNLNIPVNSEFRCGGLGVIKKDSIYQYSPDGSRWRIQILNDGTLNTTKV